MAYFQIMTGLRGCYMPDSSYVVKCDTRRELRDVLEDESVNAQEGMWGLNKRAIASAAAQAWRERKSKTAYAVASIPYGPDRKERPYILEVCTASRADYLTQNEAE